MMRLGILLASVVLTTVLSCAAWAVPPGFTIEFDGNGEGKVIFTGAKHTGPDMHCPDCHMEIFLVSRSAPITRADHKRRNFCFVCHDGKRAFAARSNCDRCHAEPDPLPTDPAATAAMTRAPISPTSRRITRR